MTELEAVLQDGYSPDSQDCIVGFRDGALVVQLPGQPDLLWQGEQILEICEGRSEIRVILKGSDARVNNPVLVLPSNSTVLGCLEMVGGRRKVRLPRPALILGLFIGIAMAVTLVLLFITNLWRLVPTSLDVALGDGLHASVLDEFGSVATDRPNTTEFLDDCVRRFKDSDSSFQPEVFVIETDLVNAFALPGGRIYVCTGLIDQAESPEELAGILGHELAHAERRHTMKSISQAAGVVFVVSTLFGVVGGLEELQTAEVILESTSILAIMHHSRKMEADADDWALRKLAQEGVSVFGMQDFFKRMQAQSQGTILERIPDWISTHPATQARLRKMEAHLEDEPDLAPLLSPEQWRRIQSEGGG